MVLVEKYSTVPVAHLGNSSRCWKCCIVNKETAVSVMSAEEMSLTSVYPGVNGGEQTERTSRRQMYTRDSRAGFRNSTCH